MTTKTKESKTIGIRLPVDWIEALKEYAELEERSVNSLIRQAVKEYIQGRKKAGESWT